MDCIFCKIVAGELPCFKVYEDGHVLAFMDINPHTPGHLLVIPKAHSVNLFDSAGEVLAHVGRALGTVARAMRTALAIDSITLTQANGPWAKQEVPHLHFHLIPRREGDKAGLVWELKPGDMENIRALGDQIAASMEPGNSR